MMKLRHIEVFHAVYQTGSVSGAARALHVSQPSVSKVLRHAEAQIGFVLFRVVKGRLVATAEAHVLFHEVRELHGQIESLQATAKNLQRCGGGHLRLAVLPSLGLQVVPRAVAKFRASHPDVSFEIKTVHKEDILRSLYERSSDIAVAYDSPRHPRLSEVSIGAAELVLLYRKQDVPDPPEQLSIDALERFDLVRLAGTGSIDTLLTSEIDTALARRTSISVETYYVAAALVREGAGVAVVDEFTARAMVGNDLDFRPLEKDSKFGVYCIHLEDRPLSLISQDFIAEMQKAITFGRA
ncbi:MAG: LysR family transcriptional regulator [Sphingomonas bacterium]|uniref:LysR family transcriptional regulator n=1 Tax=Sphingomonas bacterium TaxID=1895847 RepID=UPI002614A088|nr:LysR substrate-binding domain-containing protein [Sphingomonas bacterium]MDB5705287.1 LysR family transcriptional regulator [Sphingomonas bacterium]